MAANGASLAGGLLYFYQSGTSTPANTYSDAALTIPNANPIVLNASGYAGSIFFIVGQQYKVVLTDASGVQQWTADPVSDPTAAGQSFSSYVAVTAAAGATRSVFLQSSGSNRWALQADTTAESGANAGSNFALVSYTDAGAVLSTVMSVNRATGLVSFPGGLKQPTTTQYLSGSGTYTTPNGAVRLRIRMIAGGGGGGGTGSAGAGNGGTGGTTSFGTITCIGGSGGALNGSTSVAEGGAGGTGGVGTTLIRAAGSPGSSGAYNSAGVINQQAGDGGTSPFGGAGAWSGTNAARINAATNSGSGAAGAVSSSTTFGSGGGGGSGEYAEFIITSPAASYAYAIGAAGTVGAAGTSGTAGGLGGSGAIYVEEFYY